MTQISLLSETEQKRKKDETIVWSLCIYVCKPKGVSEEKMHPQSGENRPNVIKVVPLRVMIQVLAALVVRTIHLDRCRCVLYYAFSHATSIAQLQNLSHLQV